ncbi:hypothetical protein HMSSN036_18790 [Paenibacillus macerans]|nr:hypothetical protein HMSSN036_18790 [Paenibacillus macerans]
MDIQQLVSFVFRKIWIILACALIFAAFGWEYSASAVPKYRASVDLLVSSETDSGTYVSIQGSIKLMDTYNVLLKNRFILDKLIASLKLPLDYKELADKITVHSVDMSQIIRVTVTDTNPKMAAETVNGLAEIFQKESKKLFNLNNVYILHAVDDFGQLEPEYPSKPFYALIGLVGGGVLSLAVLLLGYLLSPHVNSRQELGGIFKGAVVDAVPGGHSRRANIKLRYMKAYREKWRTGRLAWSIGLKYKIDTRSIAALSMFGVQRTGGQAELIRSLAGELSGGIKTAVVSIRTKPRSAKEPPAKELPEAELPGWQVTVAERHEKLAEIRLYPREGGAVSLADPELLRFLTIKLKERYALLLFDLPPLDSRPDAQWILRASDHAVLVVDQGRTPRSKLNDWQLRLAELDIDVGSVVFLED